MKPPPRARFPAAAPDQRLSIRFNKVFPVIVTSELFGDSSGVARNISGGGMFVEMDDPLPLESVVTVTFPGEDGGPEIAARAEVKHHYSLNGRVGDRLTSCRGIGLRFLEFLGETDASWLEARARTRILH
jgi:hypothetical protein